MARPVVKSGSLQLQGSGGIATSAKLFSHRPGSKMEIAAMIGDNWHG
jgi:hypothetical protein